MKAKIKAKANPAKIGAPLTVDAYLAEVQEPARTTLGKVREAIRSVVPAEATESISYGIPTFRYNGALVAFGAFKNHCSFFPMSLAVMATFQKDPKNFDTAKGTIHFPLNKPLPVTLVKKLVTARLAEKERKRLR